MFFLRNLLDQCPKNHPPNFFYGIIEHVQHYKSGGGVGGTLNFKVGSKTGVMMFHVVLNFHVHIREMIQFGEHIIQ